MSFNHTISAVLRGRWMIHPGWAESHLPLVAAMLKGQPVSFSNGQSSVDRTGNQVGEMPFVVDPKTLQRVDAYKYDFRSDRMVINPAIPEGSVAVIPIGGPITKYNGDCGEPGAIKRAAQISELGRLNNIGSMVLLLDTPGGEARAAHTLVSTIQNLGKPVLSFVDGMAASLGIWITSASREVYLSNSMDEMGSIGSYVMLADFSKALEMEGITLHEIYAPQSTDKNKDYRDAIKGEYGAIQEDLKVHVDQFIQFVKTNRPQSAAHVDQWGSGKMFYAADAIKLGLADGVAPLNRVIKKAAWLGSRNK